MGGSVKTVPRRYLTVDRRHFLGMGAAAFAPGWARSHAGDEPAPAENVGLPPIPYPKSKVIKGIRWLGEPLHDRNYGDTWGSTWSDDDFVYSVGDDTSGTGTVGWNLSVYKVAGMPPQHVVTRVNEMQEYDKAGAGHWWKGAGMASIDGVLYMGIYSQSVPGQGSATKISFNADHASIILSTDHGKTWKPTATVESPLFPGKEFPTPFFVQYGKDYSDAMDEYVYLVSNDGGWNNWNRMILARVARRTIGQLNRSDWEFFTGTGRHSVPLWGRDARQAKAVFEHQGYTSMTGMQYVPAVQRFVLGQWAYVAMKGGGDRTAACPAAPPWHGEAKHETADQTMLCLYEAPKPWGPWRLFHAQPKWGPAFYNPNFPSKWFENGGRRLWIVEGGNYRGPAGGYNFTVQQLELIL